MPVLAVSRGFSFWFGALLPKYLNTGRREFFTSGALEESVEIDEAQSE
jgi:hypothetical protein